MKDLLQKLEDLDMHVHVIDHSAGYEGFKQPIAHLVMSSHFIMQGAEVVHIGKLSTIKGFVDRQ